MGWISWKSWILDTGCWILDDNALPSSFGGRVGEGGFKNPESRIPRSGQTPNAKPQTRKAELEWAFFYR